ncbi:MAG: hypothetical protein V4757_02565 [Pseudomonadota bacterium]
MTRIAPFLAAAALMVLLTPGAALAQSYQPGQRVECDTTGSGKWWGPGVIQPFQKGDFGSQPPDGSWYRFKADSNGVEYPCKPAFMRPLAGGAAGGVAAGAAPAKAEAAPARAAMPQQRDAGTAGLDFLSCPFTQKAVKNGARPDVELFRKVLRCKKGEKAVAANDEGAVRVEVVALQVGTPRPWSYRQDLGNGKQDTVVYPVKVSYTIKTYYRAATEVSEGWVRVANYYVDAFGEWQIGSEEPVSPGRFQRIPR